MGSTAPPTIKKQCKQHKKQTRKQTQTQQLTANDRVLVREIMQRHCLLRNFSRLQLQQIVCKLKKECISIDTYIYRQFDTSQACYMLLSGRVTQELDCKMVKVFGPADYFGHQTMMYGALRSESIRVLTSCAFVCSMQAHQLFKLHQTALELKKPTIKRVYETTHFYNYLTNIEKSQIINNTVVLTYDSQEVIFEAEQEANSLHVISRGRVSIKVQDQEEIILASGEYFGETCLELLLKRKSRPEKRFGKAVALDQNTEIFSIGLPTISQSMGNLIRSIIFFNKEKWAVYRSIQPQQYDICSLLQLFNVKIGQKYTILAEVGSDPKDLFVALDGEINNNGCPYLYNGQHLKQCSKLSQSLVLTSAGYYAYAPLDKFKEILKKKISKDWLSTSLQSMRQSMTLTLKNVSLYGRKLPSSKHVTVLIVQDMKFGNGFVVKIYPKHPEQNHLFNPSTVPNHLQQKSQRIRSNASRTGKISHGKSLNKINEKSKKTIRKNIQQIPKDMMQKGIKNTLVQGNGVKINVSQNISYKSIMNTDMSPRNNVPHTSISRRNLESTSRINISTKTIKESNTLIKTVHTLNHDQDSIKAKIERERQILQSCCNKFIGGYYKCQVDRNHYYILTQYIPGVPLFEVMAQLQVLPDVLCKYYFASLVSALEYLHAKGVVVRDLKPQNAIVRKNGELVLVDLACAKRLQDNRTNTMVGTPHYMPPEVINRRPYGYNVDLWSVGVILYEFVMGKVPFAPAEEDPYLIFQAINCNQVYYRSTLSKDTYQMLVKLLEKDPMKRLQSVKEVKKLAYLSQVEFRMKQFQNGQMNPPYFPPDTTKDYVNVNNYNIFDLQTLQDWK